MSFSETLGLIQEALSASPGEAAPNHALQRTGARVARPPAAERGRSPNMAAGGVDLVREPGGQGSTFTFTFTLRVHDEHRA